MKLSSTDKELLSVINKMDSSVKARAYAALLCAEDCEFSYREVCQSFNALLSSGMIRQINGKLADGGIVITAKGRAVIAYISGLRNNKASKGSLIAEEEFEITSTTIPFTEEEWNWAISGLQEESKYFSSPVEQAKQYAVSKWKPVIAVICWLLSLACLATGIIFACLPWVAGGWKTGAAVIGAVLYSVLGMISCGLVTSRVKYTFEKFISIVSLPALGLLLLIVLILGYV